MAYLLRGNLETGSWFETSWISVIKFYIDYEL